MKSKNNYGEGYRHSASFFLVCVRYTSNKNTVISTQVTGSVMLVPINP